MRQHFPVISGIPLTYWEGDVVKTRDGREGIVLGYEWDHKLVIYRDGKPSKGFYIVTVDFGNYAERFLRHDLTGKRFPKGGFW